MSAVAAGSKRETATLLRFLRETVPDVSSAAEFVSLRRAAAGFSYETWLARLCDRDTETTLILRREPATGPLEPYDVGREARVLEALSETEVPVPRLLALCQDAAVWERRFAVLEHVEGEVPDYRTITGWTGWRDESQRDRLADEFIAVLAAIQRVDWSDSRFSAVLEAPPSAAERIRRRVEALMFTVDAKRPVLPPHPSFRDAGLWLKRHAEEAGDGELVLVHGDYKLGNLVWRAGRVVGVLDWEGAAVGYPLEDLGYACHPIMRERAPRLMAMLAPLDQLLAAYESATGRDVDRRRLHLHVILALYFHAFTVVLGLAEVAAGRGDVRLGPMYSKLNQVTRHLADEIGAYEEGRGVL